MNAATLELLLAGQYICEHRYPDAAASLASEDTQAEVNTWLRSLGMRLARVGDEGPWFMAPLKVTDRHVSQLRTELREFRDTYGPAVQMLDFIRQAAGDRVSCSPGERIQLVSLETQVASSTTHAARLRDLVQHVISGGSGRFTDRENLRKLMEHLARDGYVILAERSTETYLVTGKVEQLYAVLAFLDENKVIEEDSDDQLDLSEDESGGEEPQP